jgi:hypothetical protein
LDDSDIQVEKAAEGYLRVHIRVAAVVKHLFTQRVYQLLLLWAICGEDVFVLG